MKFRVLVCAYACVSESGVKVAGGEAILGWNIVQQLGRFHEVWVLTHAENRSAIERALRWESLPQVHFEYVRLPGWLRALQRLQGGIQLCAYVWQIYAYFVARRLHRRVTFDAFHHLTYANDWMASFIGALLPVPFLRGPGGGAHRTPKAFWRRYSLPGRLAEHLRAIGQRVLRHDPFFWLGQRRALAILVCNQEAFDAIPRRWQHKTLVFPVNGISQRDLIIGNSRETPRNRFRVVSAGKLLRIKGFDLAIRAFKVFADRHPGSELFIIGDGPELVRLEGLVQSLDLEPQVRFKGWMAREELLAEMRSCDAFLFASLRDGGGAVVIEAMAAGKPVVCINLGGPGLHVTDECGIRVFPHSPEQVVREMAAALERLYADRQLCCRMGRAARMRAEQEYHWDRLGDRLREIYVQRVLCVFSGVEKSR